MAKPKKEEAVIEEKEAPEIEETPEDDVPVHIPSEGRPWIKIDGVKHITGSVNSESFQVRCDEPTTIKRKFYSAIVALVQ